jgi:hypothetical protein
MKKFRILSITVVLAMLLALAPAAMAAGPSGSWVSGISCQNLDAVNAATVDFLFYNPDGSVALDFPDSIPAGGTLKYFTPSSPTGLPSPFQGSAVVSSNTPLACNVNTQLNSTGTQASPFRVDTSGGFADTEVGTTMYAPQVEKTFSGIWNSYIAVQNTTNAAVTVQVSYKDRNGVAVGAAAENRNLPAYGNTIFYQNDNTNLPGNFLGSAVIAATNPTTTPLAVTVAMYNSGADYTASQFLTYNAFPTGSTLLYIPRIVRKYYGYNGGLTIQNVSGTATNLEVDFFFAGTQYVYTTPSKIQPGASAILYLPNVTQLNPVDGLAMSQHFGSAVVKTLDAGASAIAIVNEDNRGNAADNGGVAVPVERIGQGASYNAIPDGSQTANVFYAQIPRAAGGVYSGGIIIANTTNTASTCNITYSGVPAATQNNVALPANGQISVYAPNVPNLPNGFNASVSATCGQPVVGLGNLAAAPGTGKYGDSFAEKSGVNR